MSNFTIQVDVVTTGAGIEYCLPTDEDIARYSARLDAVMEKDKKERVKQFLEAVTSARQKVDAKDIVSYRVTFKRPTVGMRIEIDNACTDPLTGQYRAELEPLKALSMLAVDWSLDGKPDEQGWQEIAPIALFDRCWNAVQPLLHPPTNAIDFFAVLPVGVP